MARIAGNGLKAALFGAPSLLNTTTVSSAVAAVGFPSKMGRSFSGVVACASPAAAEAAAPTKTRKPRGIMKPRPISPEFQEFVGAPEISRTQALKVIWDHIKANKLQDPNNKKIINCDEKLKKIFAGKETVGFLEISGLITPHLL